MIEAGLKEEAEQISYLLIFVQYDLGNIIKKKKKGNRRKQYRMKDL